jgi:DNA-binding beta-propeller fold protein YncE
MRVLEVVTGLLFGEPDYLELIRPMSGLVDSQGRILVTDMGRPGVVVFDLKKKSVDLWQTAAHGVDFVSPVAIAEDGTGGYYVTDSQLGEIFHLDATGHPLQGFGKKVVNRPTGIARDPESGNYYVTDTGYHRVVVFSAQGEVIDIIGSRGELPGQFNYPTHIAVRGDRIYVSDTLNFRIQVFDRNGEGKLAFGQLGENVGDMTRPKGVGAGKDGRIYVIESYYDHILIFDSKGQFLLPIDGARLDVGPLYLPAGIWSDPEGRVYVADMFNGRVCVFKELTVEGDKR